MRVLAGKEEAHFAAEGVIAAIPDADGLAADLGGGSLDMVMVKGGRTGEPATLPFGPLRLIDLAKGDTDKARQMVDGELAKLPQLKTLDNRTLYAVGGIWRSFARVDMLRERYPLHMLQQYTISYGRALELCNVLAKQSRKSLELMSAVSKRRMELLPYGAVVLHRLLMTARFKEVVISRQRPARRAALRPAARRGARQGSADRFRHAGERAVEPLARPCAARCSNGPRPCSATRTRSIAGCARRPACSATSAGGAIPITARCGTYEEVLYMPFAGADHRAREFIATAVYHRYSGDEDMPPRYAGPGLLGKQDEKRAFRIGLAARRRLRSLGLGAGRTVALPLAADALQGRPGSAQAPRRDRRRNGQKAAGALASAMDRKARNPGWAVNLARCLHRAAALGL